MNGVKQAIRNVARPLVRCARSLLEPTPVNVVDQWRRISGGPAKGCEILLPCPSGFEDKIVPGQYEVPCTKVMESLVSPNSVCFDIGGHYGYFTLVLASLASQGRVETFEPMPSHATRIGESAERSGLTHVNVNSKAMADVSTTMTLRYVSGGNYDSMGYLESRGGVVSESAKEQYPTFQSLRVETTTLDSLQSMQPTFIKIDAEGAEASILRGGINLLKNQQPRLLVEIHGIREAFECANVVRDLGYRIMAIGEPETTMPVLCVSENDNAAMEALDQIYDEAPMLMFDSQP